jgi:hypothetical protein
MTDTPKRFPYGGGPARRYVNPRSAGAAGFEVAELPGSDTYFEPPFDHETDGAPSLAAEPGVEIELDFDAEFGATAVALELAAAGPSGAGHLAINEFDYVGWECGCKATAKTGIPPRHYRQLLLDDEVSRHGTDYMIVVLPGKGEIKQAKGETQANDAGDDEPAEAVECSTWRPAVRSWKRAGRDWTKGKHGIKPDAPAAEPEPSAPAQHPAGPTSAIEPAGVADFSARCTAKSLAGYAETMLKVSGRMADDGPIVHRLRLAGATPDGARWVAEWTDGKFASARFNGSEVNLAMLRKAVKAEGAVGHMTLI